MLNFLYNTNIVVAIAFAVFVGFLIYKGVPAILNKLLDKRADDIRAELEEAKRLREEAQEIFASYERRVQEVEAEAAEIVKQAKANAKEAAKEAKANLAEQMERRVQAGKDQIASAEAAVERQIRANAADIATKTAREVLLTALSAKSSSDLIDEAIAKADASMN